MRRRGGRGARSVAPPPIRGAKAVTSAPRSARPRHSGVFARRTGGGQRSATRTPGPARRMRSAKLGRSGIDAGGIRLVRCVAAAHRGCRAADSRAEPVRRRGRRGAHRVWRDAIASGSTRRVNRGGKLTLSRTTCCRGGPSNVRPPHTFQGVALLHAGLLRCRVDGPSTSGREHLDPKPRRAPHILS